MTKKTSGEICWSFTMYLAVYAGTVIKNMILYKYHKNKER